ncbi:MAG: FAD-binding oxidoreductase [Betaproteobacteria bacterium]|nr:FAD-binding oxidoreductase [Betaproteobacteria bacterium]
MIKKCDFLVVGAGIAGASAAYELALQGDVILLEREAHPDYHSTGRSAAIFLETYGGATVRALTLGSRAFYENPPEGFSDTPLVQPRGALFMATEASLPKLSAHFDTVSQMVKTAKWLDAGDLHKLLPCLRREIWVAGAWEPDAQDLDVNAIHQGFLRGFRRCGGVLRVDTGLISARRRQGIWHVQTTTGTIETPYLVNAAGAWCDAVAEAAGVRPIGLTPLRRTAITFDAPDETARWPYFGDIAESFYVKPDAGCLLASPCDETPVEACDVAPEEYDVAVIADRVERMTTLPVKRILSKWAGLRTFSADRTPVAGWAPDAEGFFWLAGQGGYGIQTAPAMALCCKSLMLDNHLPANLAAFGVTPSNLSPQRFHTSPSTAASTQVYAA